MDPDVSVPTPALLHVKQKLFEYIRQRDLNNARQTGQPYCCFVSAINLMQYRDIDATVDDASTKALVKGITEAKSLKLGDGTPKFQINPWSGRGKLIEGNHRLRRMLQLGYAWFPIEVLVDQANPLGGHKIGSKVDKTLIATHAHDQAAYWKRITTQVLIRQFNLQVMQFHLEYTVESFRGPIIDDDDHDNEHAEYERFKRARKVECVAIGCNNVATHACAGCHKQFYCGKQCALADWKTSHRAACTKLR